MTDKEKIKAEIERLREVQADKALQPSIDEQISWLAGKTFALASIELFIDSLTEEPVSEDLEKTSKEYADKNYVEWLDFVSGDERDDHYPISEAFKAGAKWKKEQFEKNRLKHCNSITNEQSELEQGFIDQHLDKHQRIPTFLDAIEYGMNIQKEQMMKKITK